MTLSGAEPEFVPGQVIVKLRPGLSLQEGKNLLEEYGATVERRFQLPAEMAAKVGGELMLWELPTNLTTEKALEAMRSDDRLAMAVPNHVVRAFSHQEDEPTPPPQQGQPPTSAPDDLHQQQWALANTGQTGGTTGADINALDAWKITTGSNQGPLIAIVDSGVIYDNPELSPNIWTNPDEVADGVDNDGNGIIDDLHGVNFVDKNGDPKDDSGHGTHIASVIAAKGNNGAGMAGINWDARIMPLKFLEKSGRGSIADAISAIAYAETKGARIVVNGWGSEIQNQALFEVMKASQAMHICASGNDGYDNDVRPVHPASFPLDNIISVAATDHDDEFTPFSNLGPDSVDLAAPGRKVYVMNAKGEYELLGGTSIAAAHVAGVAGLIATRYPDISNEALRTRLLSGVDPLPKKADRVATGGRLDAARSLENDTTPPGAPSDLWVSNLTPTSVGLSWTATGDDALQGRAHHYQMRWAEQPIVEGEVKPGQVSFDQANPFKVAAPGEAGKAEQVSVDFGPSGKNRKLYFALRAVDNVGNRSAISTAEATIPSSTVAFEDTFDLKDTPWTAEGEWARVPTEGRGMVWTDSPDKDYDNNLDVSITSPTISLKDWRNAQLHFDSRYTIEPGHDSCEVEVYGKKWWWTKWRSVASLDGYSDWKNTKIDLSDYEGQDIKIRFRLKTDKSRTAYGIQLDNTVITGEKRQAADGH